jgi:gamma-glutamyltranspeptidase/glutathione hydrolase
LALIILVFYERIKATTAESFEHLHGLVEANKRGVRVRERVVTDFDRLKHDPASFLTPDALDREANAIDPRRAAPWPDPAGKGDTIWLGAADSSGLAVSYIQSLYFEFGSGCVLPGTGIILNDGRVMAYGTMGGEGQPQTQSAVFTRYVDYAVPLGESIDRPRWILGRTWGSTITNLRLESRFSEAAVEGLRRAGHDVAVLPEAHAEVMGHAGAVVLHPDGTVEGAHDPRSDGGAAGV